MAGHTDARFVEVLTRIVREAKELEKGGRLLDSVSHTEVALLEHELRVVEARLAATALGHRAAPAERAAAVADWARALQAASRVTRSHSRQVRKDLYRTRLNIAASPD